MRSYSDEFERDWNFYKKERLRFCFSGKPLTHYAANYDPNGMSAKESFYHYDSTGMKKDTCEPVLLAEVFRCKASVNLHIKMWARGRADGTFPRTEFIN